MGGFLQIWGLPAKLMYGFLVAEQLFIYTKFPHIVSAETILFWIWLYVLRPLVIVHKCAEIIQGRKLYEEIRYLVIFFIKST